MMVKKSGNVFHLDDEGEPHREDGPAIEWKSGSREWCWHGRLHREDGPAREMNDGTREWFYEGQRHRGDGPAVIKADGTEQWWCFGSEVPPPAREMLACVSRQLDKVMFKEWWDQFRPAREMLTALDSQIIDALREDLSGNSNLRDATFG
jgi:hypothetical protein